MIASWMERAVLAGVRAIGEARAEWRGCGPAGGAQRIYCSNHVSHFDSLLLSAALPDELRRRTRPVAAAEYWSAGPVRRFLSERVFRSVLIDRERRSLNPLEPVFEALRAGDSLIYFPEGTRGAGGTVGPLKAGIFHIARGAPAAEIVPVWIEGSQRIMPKGFKIPRPARCGVRFGAPLRWDGAEDEAQFLERLREAMLAECPR